MKRILLALVALPLAGCPTARRGEPFSGTMLLSGELAAGEARFMRVCHECHPNGEAGLGPALNNKPLPGPVIRLQIREGLGAMPAFSERQLPDRDVDAIIAYLEALRRRDPER